MQVVAGIPPMTDELEQDIELVRAETEPGLPPEQYGRDDAVAAIHDRVRPPLLRFRLVGLAEGGELDDIGRCSRRPRCGGERVRWRRVHDPKMNTNQRQTRARAS
jgi:hypothetical protein